MGQQTRAVRPRQHIGYQGEEWAARYLVGLGWTVLDRNWRGTRGELDVVAREADELVVVEVKTRTSQAFGHPALAVGRAKLARLGRLGGQWLAEHDQHVASVRIDVVAVLLSLAGPPCIDHLRGVQP